MYLLGATFGEDAHKAHMKLGNYYFIWPMRTTDIWREHMPANRLRGDKGERGVLLTIKR
jgi:hypothetical protein